MSSPFTLTIDWLAFTVPTGSARETMEIIGGDWTKANTGFRGYRHSWITASAGRGIGKLGTGAARDPVEVHVDLSGGIVASWPHEKVRALIRWVMSKNGHLTRIDCAFDDRASSVSLTTIKEAVAAGQCVTRADHLQCISSGSIHKGTPTGETIYIGSRQSTTCLRIYDKRLQLQTHDHADWEQYGIRWELELKKERAQLCGKLFADYCDEPHWLELLISSFLRPYIEFLDTTRDAEDEYRCRAPLLDWWETLTDGFRKSRLVVEKEPHTLAAVKGWLHHAVGPSLAVVLEQPDGVDWLRKVVAAGKKRWKTKHHQLLPQSGHNGESVSAWANESNGSKQQTLSPTPEEGQGPIRGAGRRSMQRRGLTPQKDPSDAPQRGPATT